MHGDTASMTNNSSAATAVTDGIHTIDADFNVDAAAGTRSTVASASAPVEDAPGTLHPVDESQPSSREGHSDSIDSCLSGTSF